MDDFLIFFQMLSRNDVLFDCSRPVSKFHQPHHTNTFAKEWCIHKMIYHNKFPVDSSKRLVSQVLVWDIMMGASKRLSYESKTF